MKEYFIITSIEKLKILNREFPKSFRYWASFETIEKHYGNELCFLVYYNCYLKAFETLKPHQINETTKKINCLNKYIKNTKKRIDIFKEVAKIFEKIR